jgi:hypothetical protein
LTIGKVDLVEVIDQDVSGIALNVGFVNKIFKPAESDAGS